MTSAEVVINCPEQMFESSTPSKFNSEFTVYPQKVTEHPIGKQSSNHTFFRGKLAVKTSGVKWNFCGNFGPLPGSHIVDFP